MRSCYASPPCSRSSIEASTPTERRPIRRQPSLHPPKRRPPDMDENQEKKQIEPKPAFLGPHVASAFQEASVIEAYPYRAPYPESLFQKLAELTTGSSRAVLDVGTGPG